MKSQVSPGSASLARGLPTKASRAPVRRSSWGLRTNAVRAQAQATATAIENATATTTNHMSEPTVGKAAPVKPTEYNYTKQMKPGPYRMTMGLEPMNPADWMEIDSLYEEEMQLRREILEDKRHLVVACQPCAKEACAEMLQMLADFLPKEYPEHFQKQGNILTALKTNETFEIEGGAMDPLEACARIVQEDLCIMQDVGGTLKFTAGAVLFPQRWSLLEKIGADMKAIHSPVPKFHKEVSKPVDAFMQRLSPPKPFWRANWAITDHPQLFQPLTEEDITSMTAGQKKRDAFQEVTPENAGQTLFTRCERETLVRFPKTQAILFTIRTYIRNLAWYAARPNECATLADALRNLPEDLTNYKTMAHIKDQAQEYLDSAIKT